MRKIHLCCFSDTGERFSSWRCTAWQTQFTTFGLSG